MSSKDALRRLEEMSLFSNLHDAKTNMSGLMNQFSQNKMIRQIRMNSQLAKLGAMGIGQEKLDALAGHGMFNNITQASAYSALLGLPTSGSVMASSMLDAHKRAAYARQSSGTNGVVNNYDTAAAGLNSIKNLSNLGKNTFYLNTALAGLLSATGHGTMGGVAQGSADIARNSFMFGPAGGGLLASKMMGGVSGLGSITGGALSSVLKTAGISGVSINPMLAGVATMMLLSKGSMALNKFVNDKSSLNQNTTKRSTIMHRKSPHQLEAEYGSTQLYTNMILRLQNTGQIDTQTAILGQILAAIEGHTSVLPLLAAEFVNKDKKSEKQTNKALNGLSDKFGEDGKLSRWDQNKRNDPGKLFKIASGLERYSSQLQSTFDIMGQLSNTLNGKSSTVLANEAKNIGKTGDLLEAKKEFGRKFGVSTNMVQAIHTTPSQIMNDTDTYEGRVLSILGLISEINRFNAHELLQIRTKGFGIKDGESSSYLSKAEQRIEEEREAEEGRSQFYEKFFKSIDEKLGYIPTYNVVSGSIKMLNDIVKDVAKIGKENAEDPTKSGFKDWLLNSFGNKELGSEESIKNAIGANELSAEQRMASYLGFDYPNKFEELLDHIKRIDESTASMAGPIKRNSRQYETMNNFTGLMGTNKYHETVHTDIIEKLNNELDTLEDSDSLLKNIFMFGNKNKNIMKQYQKDRFFKNNPTFVDDLYNTMDSDGGQKTLLRTDVNSSDDDIQYQQNKQKLEEEKARSLSISEKQLITLYEIRDILDEGGTGKGKKGSRAKKDYAGDLLKDKQDLMDSLYLDLDAGGRDSNNKQRNKGGTNKAGWIKRFARVMGVAGVARMGAAGAAGAAGVGSVAAMLAPIVVTTLAISAVAGAGYLLYKNYEQIEDRKEKYRKNQRVMTASDYNNMYENKSDVEKATYKDWINELEMLDPTADKEKIEAWLKSKSTDELKMMQISLTKKEKLTDTDQLFLKIITSKFEEKSKQDEKVKSIDLDPKFRLSVAGEMFYNMGAFNHFDNQNDDFKNKLLNADDQNGLDSTNKRANLLKMFRDGNLTENDLIALHKRTKSEFVKRSIKNILENDIDWEEATDKQLNEVALEVSEHMDTVNSKNVMTVSNTTTNRDLLNDAKMEQVKVDKSKENRFNHDIQILQEAFESAITNVDIDKNGNKTQGLTATEMRNLQTLAEQISANTGANISQNFGALIEVLASQSANTQEALNAMKKFVSNKGSGTLYDKVQNS